MRAYPETHQKGTVSVENLSLVLGFPLNTGTTVLKDADIGVQIAKDGRVWVCINGIGFIRFKPKGMGFGELRQERR